MGDEAGFSGMRRIVCFEDLFVWQKAIEFAKEIYLITEKDGFKTDFGLKNQIRNAAVSISPNIAEGFAAFQKGVFEFSEYCQGVVRRSQEFITSSLRDRILRRIETIGIGRKGQVS